MAPRLLITGCFVLNLVVVGMGQTFTGYIQDSETNKPVPFANVYFVELETGTTADVSGVFRIEHSPSTKIRIQISAIGYKTLSEVLDLTMGNEKEFKLEESHVDLDEVVISTPAGKLANENVVSIERKKLEILQQGAPTSLAEAITEIPGVSQNSTGTGIGKPVIRGLSGNRIVTYAQGIRIENQQWGQEHGLGVGEVGIESVEVIKGPASLLYGSDALGGVLFFVNERYAEHNTIQGYMRSRVTSNSLGNANNLVLKLHKGRLKVNMFGTYASNADYRQPNKERVFNSRFDEKNFKTALGFDLKNWISNIRYSYLQNNFGIPEDTMISTTDRTPVMPYQVIGNHALSWENKVFVKNSKVNLIVGYTGNRRREYEDLSSSPALDMDLETYSYNLKWYAPEIRGTYNLIVGGQGMYQTNFNRGEESLIPNGVTVDMGAFTVFNYSEENVSFQAGLRADQRGIKTEQMVDEGDTIDVLDQRYSNVNFAAGAVFRGEKLTFRTNLSSGFRAPTASELLSFGVHEGTNRFEIGNRYLRSEKATQVDVTLDYRSEHLNFQINGFYNTINNYIFLAPLDSIMDGSPAFEYIQATAKLYGGEAGVHYHPHSIHWLHFESSIATVFAEDDMGSPLPLIPATKLNSMVKLEFSKESTWRVKNIYFQHVYTMRQARPGPFETATGDYHLLSLGAALEIGDGANPIEFSAGVKNLLNTTYIDHLSRLKPMGISNQGINLFASIKIPFGKQIAEAKEN